MFNNFLIQKRVNQVGNCLVAFATILPILKEQTFLKLKLHVKIWAPTWLVYIAKMSTTLWQVSKIQISIKIER